ncbi:uroporphyrin-III C-methyltransferase/precorrin-2 dehydrogenase/sirohydrochlorin ferrochelatase [Chitinivorax tropicus]|uniref:Siroheme synthase n=1 Tax=Chitinivorax tropicus TaxID=714531 RepID=A0A840MU80_9PROT|nr:siroheme synthase CysG [Chitinivorax tropicus]MBB5018731.1 uroporphyrin-III C-methyltransferase/precorrin-2 dehydrogenase/sirohydrochlorin ferrochelatase [Chitinivorax tropicus]
MDHFPIFMNLKGRPCVVVGGGDVAARKAGLLAKAGANLTLVSPTLTAGLAEEAQAGRLAHIAEPFHPSHLDEAILAIAATDDMQVNKAVADAAQSRRIPVNVVDQPALCSFIMPAIIDRSPVVIAVSTGGGVPVLARLLRAKLETMIPATYGDLARLATEFRERVKKRFTSVSARRIFWEDVLQGHVAEKVFAGNLDAGRHLLEQALTNMDQPEQPTGTVYLIGGGPGNPDLLTFRALRLMQQADVVLHDALVAPEIVDLCRRDAERIYVGKQSSNHALPQHEINQLLVHLAQQGKRVARLKGGDPFIFGRGGEEIETLVEHNIPFEVVPGITSAQGASSYAGIPLTHRDHAQSCTFVTGHRRDGTGAVDLDWPSLTRPEQTVVVYMGVGQLPDICQQMITHGRAADTPAAIIERATTDKQRVIIGTLANLPDHAVQQRVKAPALIVIGGVVTLHDKLKWFKTASLQAE